MDLLLDLAKRSAGVQIAAGVNLPAANALYRFLYRALAGRDVNDL